MDQQNQKLMEMKKYKQQLILEDKLYDPQKLIYLDDNLVELVKIQLKKFQNTILLSDSEIEDKILDIFTSEE